VAGYAAHERRIRLLRCDGANQAAAMNLGVREARGTIVARVDAHGHVAPDYVAQAVAALARHPSVVAVGGPYLPSGERLLERVAWLARSSRIGVGGGWYSDKQPVEHVARTVGCPAYRRDALLAAGLFDPAMAYGEDDELHWRLAQRGGQILFCPGLKQYNRPRASLRALARQYWNYGRGRLRVLRKHPDFVQPRHLVPSAFVVVLLATALGAAVAPAGRAALIALLVLYGGALAVAGALVLRHGVREALLVPWAVAVMHLAYGGGMLCGALAALVSPRTLERKEAIP
jgi:GT2 family glycosyltransferase